MKKLCIILFLFVSNLSTLFAGQDSMKYPRIGERCPDFLLTDVQQFHKTEVTLDDFKGKWLILDFWGEFCAACIRAFPKMNQIQETFAKDTQVLLIGIPYKDPNNIKKLYEVHREKQNLKIPIVFDEKLAEQFGVRTYPHLVVVDPNGIVRYITTGLSVENVQDMINGRPITVYNKYNTIETKPYDDYNRDIPFLIAGNGGDELDYLYRSVLARATERTPHLRFYTYTVDDHDRIEFLGYPLAGLYQYAYMNRVTYTLHNILDSSLYGAYWPRPLIEVKDSSLFSPNPANKENMFSYSVHISGIFAKRADQATLDFREILKKDLHALFPFTARLEYRMMPCYYLRINEDKIGQLKSKHEKQEIRYAQGHVQGFVGKKISLSQIITKLITSPGYNSKIIPMVFEGDDIEIDIEYESVYFEDIVRELKPKGIEITKGQKEMTVLVIRDK